MSFSLTITKFLWKMYNVVWFLTKWFFFPLNFWHSNSWPIEILCRYILYTYIVKSSGYPKSAYDPGWRMVHSTPIPQTHPLYHQCKVKSIGTVELLPSYPFFCINELMKLALLYTKVFFFQRLASYLLFSYLYRYIYITEGKWPETEFDYTV